ncbi:hypothetical protein NKJ09_23350 [Mesorhizobium sp. M0189]|uniref:hypothetical protein n=1 Tax=Mesorhizobium sp. M0189 TaxID=2956909 RepID=UPI0033351107
MAEHVCAENVEWHLNLQHFGDTNIKYLEVKGACNVCNRAVSFRGPAGLNQSHPTVAIDGSEAVFPFLFSDEEFDGKAVGFSVSIPGGN